MRLDGRQESRVGIASIPPPEAPANLERRFVCCGGALRTAIGQNLVFLRGFSDGVLGCDACEFIDICTAGGQQRGSNSATVGGQHIAMGARDFADQAMSAQQG
jgi:hypothetical protein